MGHRFGALTFTDRVKALQEAQGSRRAYAKREHGPDGNDRLGPDEAEFISARDSFYMATVSETGWPYVQHRGGPKGFVRVLDEKTMVFADVRGNKQFISVGNVMGDDRVSFIFMDYPHQTRLKVLGRAEIVEKLPADQMPVLDERVVERFFKVRIEGVDWNCPQGITPRYTLDELRQLMPSP
ncbi:MAG: pyridoxamine 5'-phosphate oxidase family protein [Archangium sp.]|nr:pyridoxamine 5'-phosphate oxidase family protein [Archangium sp.]MDP3152036.1 pyridoxamine 5'-phosphate oxidase family protein [Archangium sp.]MDP3575478.1 pyridoxamine 5'-phosphate oxidase family protein [Archangium sp.]